MWLSSAVLINHIVNNRILWKYSNFVFYFFTNMIFLGFDCCCLTLQPCDNPVVTKEGWLYDKESILKFMLEKKKEYAKKLKEYERQKVILSRFLSLPATILCFVIMKFELYIAFENIIISFYRTKISKNFMK